MGLFKIFWVTKEDFRNHSFKKEHLIQILILINLKA